MYENKEIDPKSNLLLNACATYKGKDYESKVIKLLLDKGTSPNAEDEDRRSPLDLLCLKERASSHNWESYYYSHPTRAADFTLVVEAILDGRYH